MQLEGVGIAQPQKHGQFQLWLKFGRQAYCVIELQPGKDVADVAKKLRELAAQLEARAHLTPAILRGDEAQPAHQSDSA
jgi:hypothetical protein